jgi:hypothetical protein
VNGTAIAATSSTSFVGATCAHLMDGVRVRIVGGVRVRIVGSRTANATVTARQIVAGR